MARLTAAARNALPDSTFAGPNRTYPIEDASHARNALARIAQHGGPRSQARISRKVAGKYPTIKQQALANVAGRTKG